MVKKIIINILLKWYIKQSREVIKLEPAEEFKMYGLANVLHVEKLLKSLMTAYTLLYFEASSEEERMMYKGGALAMKSILQGNKKQRQIEESTSNVDEQVKQWLSFKKIFKI